MRSTFVRHFLELQFKSQLDRSGASRPNDRVASSNVRSGAPGTKKTVVSGVLKGAAIAAIHSERICKLRVVQHIEKLCAELSCESFSKPPVLEN